MFKTLATSSLFVIAIAGSARAQVPNHATAAAATPSAGAARPAGIVPSPDYVIGPEDVLSVVFWRDKDMSLEVAVRPDGKITLPLLNDIQAAGLTPAQLSDRLVDGAKQFIEDPNVTVIVRQINSRRVFVTGEVNKPGPYPLMGPTTVLQILATAGGVREYADSKHIVVLRNDSGRTTMFRFNYNNAAKPQGVKENIELKPGDTIVVP
jgi:polysaccharide export outer membrane protein